MPMVNDFVEDSEAQRIGGSPKVGDLPTDEISNAEYVSIKSKANATVKLDTGVYEVDDGDTVTLNYMRNAANHYAGILIRLQWTDKGNRLPDLRTEYARLVARIYNTIVGGVVDTTRAVTITTEYQSHGLNPDVEPHMSTTD